jgi:hypothetical protein
VAHQHRRVEAQRVDGFGQVAGRIANLDTFEARAFAVAARVEHDQVEGGRQRGGQPGPAQTVVGEAVREHQRRSVAAGAAIG